MLSPCDLFSQGQYADLSQQRKYVLSEFSTAEHHYLVFGFENVEASNQSTLPQEIEAILRNFNYLEKSRFLANGKFCLIVQLEADASADYTAIAQLLTEREFEIMTLVAQGLSNKQIAKKLTISEWTVSTHLRRMFMKLQVDNRAALVYRCAALLPKHPPKEDAS